MSNNIHFLVKKYFDYKNDELIYKARDAAYYKTRKSLIQKFNNSKVGQAVIDDCTLSNSLYFLIGFHGKTHLLSHLVWIWHFGQIPAGMCIDHIDGYTTNNKIENLRLVTYLENNRNRRISSRNTSKFSGVSYSNQNKKWRADISVSNKQVCLGFFDTWLEAVKKRIEAAEKLGYTPRHITGKCFISEFIGTTKYSMQ